MSNLQDFSGRDWLFEVLSDWARTGETPACLIIGPPGSGKSLVAERLAQLPQLLPGVLAHVHFCQFNSVAVDPLRLIEAVAGALASRYPVYRRALNIDDSRTLINIHGEASVERAECAQVTVTGVHITLNLSSERSARRAFEQLVANPIRALRASGNHEPIYVVVDALDETFDTQGNSLLIPFLSGIMHPNADLPPGLKFVLTSRPDQRIFGALGRATRVHLIEDEPLPNADIVSFLETRYADLNQGDFVSKLAARSHGNFLYAYYVAEDSRRHRDVKARQFPDGLDETYREYLERELPHDRITWRKLVRPVLGLLCVAHGEGLPHELIAGATGLRRSQVDDALSMLGQFVTLQPDTKTVRLYHDSFREFLISTETQLVYPDEALEYLNNHLLDIACGRVTLHTESVRHYLLSHLPRHLQEEDRTDALRLLLLDISWMSEKLRALGTFDLISDLELASPWPPAVALTKVLRMSAAIVDEHPEQLRAQLAGRLLENQNEALHALWRSLSDDQETMWLRPVTASLPTEVGPEYLSFHPHAGPVSCLAFSFPVDVLLSCSRGEPYIRAWSIGDREQTFTLELPAERVTSLACSATSPIAASGHKDGTICLWDLAKRSLITSLRTAQDPIVATILNGEKFYAVTLTGIITRISFTDWSTIAEQTIDAGHVTSVGVSPVSGDLFVNTTSSKAYQLSAGNLEVIQIFHETGDGGFWTHGAAIHPDGDILVTSGHDKLKHFSISTGALILSQYIGHVFFKDLTFTKSGDMLLGRSSLMEVLDREFYHKASFGNELSCMTLCHPHNLVATGSETGLIKIWDLTAPNLRQEDTFRHRGRITDIRVSDDGEIAAVAVARNVVEYWNLRERKTIGAALVDPELWYNRSPQPVGLALSPDGQYSLSAGDVGAVCAVHIPALNEDGVEGKSEVIPDPCVVGSPVTGHIAAIGSKGDIYLWNMQRDRRLAVIHLGRDERIRAVIGPLWDCVFVLTSTTLFELSVRRGKITRRTPHSGEFTGPLGWLRDGPTAIALNARGDIVCFLSGKQSGWPDVRAQLFATAPNTGRVVCVSQDGRIACWQWHREQPLWSRQTGRRKLTSIVISPEETWGLLIGEDDEIELFEIETGRSIATFMAEGPVTAAQVSQRTRIVIAGEASGRLHILEVMGQ
ncbi:AAA family ATPase [Streptomyces longisporus]|uniref:Orc1-like AAA ATPase domain-containing protein n=1 Tax=Streptomyces longisporus TaxID=1948 RepID=A0ABP6ABL1_STRLO